MNARGAVEGKRVCAACTAGDHERCDSVDAIGNFDYLGFTPICDCLGSDTHYGIDGGV